MHKGRDLPREGQTVHDEGCCEPVEVPEEKIQLQSQLREGTIHNFEKHVLLWGNMKEMKLLYKSVEVLYKILNHK